MLEITSAFFDFFICRFCLFLSACYKGLHFKCLTLTRLFLSFLRVEYSCFHSHLMVQWCVKFAWNKVTHATYVGVFFPLISFVENILLLVNPSLGCGRRLWLYEFNLINRCKDQFKGGTHKLNGLRCFYQNNDMTKFQNNNTKWKTYSEDRRVMERLKIVPLGALADHISSSVYQYKK